MRRISLVVALLVIAPVVAQADLITTIPSGGTTTILTTVSGTWGSAPSIVAGGFTVFAPSGADVWYGDSGYNLVENGSWDGIAWVGGYCWSGACTATIDLGGLYSQAGGFMNYAVSQGLPYHGIADPFITAIAADGTTVLESYNLSAAAPISTPGGLNDGAYRGISRSNADIAYLQISGSYLIEHDLTLGGGHPVPEPATLLLLSIGLGAIGLIARRRNR